MARCSESYHGFEQFKFFINSDSSSFQTLLIKATIFDVQKLQNYRNENSFHLKLITQFIDLVLFSTNTLEIVSNLQNA